MLITYPESRISEDVSNKTVITGGVTREEIAALVASHDRVMMLGHGSPWGLLSVGCFPGAGFYVIDYPMARLLRSKKNNVMIWCNADQYVHHHSLEGFFSGMFVSEETEALLMGLEGVDETMVDESNRLFVTVAGRYIEQDAKTICKNVRWEYGSMASRNPVIAYNVRRLYYRDGNQRGQ